MKGIEHLGNGLGYLYSASPTNTEIRTVENTTDGVISMLEEAQVRGPLYGNRAAVGSVTISGAVGTITSILVNGVEVLGSTASGASLEDVAADAVNKINARTQTPEYEAKLSGTIIYIYAEAAQGSTPNGYLVKSTVTGGMTVVDENMKGGANSTGVYDAAYGRRYYINANYDVDGCAGEGTAVIGDLTNAIEITRAFISRGIQQTLVSQSATIATGVLTLDRDAVIQSIVVDTEGAAATDDLQTILANDFSLYDIIILTGSNSARVTTVKHYVGASDNILLANNTDWASGDQQNCLALQLRSTGSGLRWVELFRSPNLDISVSNLRSKGLAFPVQGVATTALTAGGGTINLTPGTDQEYQLINGSAVTLAANWTIQGAGVPKDGDHFFVDMRQAITKGANTVTVFGLSLTAKQLLNGNVLVYAYYDTDGATWRARAFRDTTGVDLLDETTAASTYQTALPALVVAGRVLAINEDGTFSWVSNLGNNKRYDFTGTSATDAATTEKTLATYTLDPTQDMTVNGDEVVVDYDFTTGATADAKTVRVYFGATVIQTITGTYNNYRFTGSCKVTRTASNAQYATAMGISASGPTIDIDKSTPAENLSNTSVVVKITGQNGVANANDIVLEHFAVKVIRKS